MKRRIGNLSFGKSALSLAASLALFLTFSARSQTLAVVDPAASESSSRVAAALSASLSGKTRVLDLDLADSAFRSFKLSSPFNLDSETARNLGEAIGCRFYVLVRNSVQRRSRFGREEYYEAHASFYLVNSLTGRLDHWTIVTFEEDTPEESMEKLLGSLGDIAGELYSVAGEKLEEINTAAGLAVSETPDDKGLRPPMPYSRFSPEYTSLADLHNIVATVDIEVLIGADGAVLDTQVTRWAGYGLDESVNKAIRAMQWRPADREGKTLPMRILLRYNFRDIPENEN